MTRTFPIISFGEVDAIGIKSHADFSDISNYPYVQPFVDLDDLGAFAACDPYPIATFEPDFWLLDGNYKFKPVTPHVGLMGSFISTLQGYVYYSQLYITFDVSTTSDGLTLHFDDRTGDYVSYLRVEWKNGSSIISSGLYSPTSTIFSISNVVTGYTSINIYFYTTSKPYRFVRLLAIDFAANANQMIFQGDSIKSASIVEQIDPTSTIIPINSLDFTLYSKDANFSIFNPAGQYTVLKKKEPIHVYESVDAVLVYMGKFYLDSWKNTTLTTITMHASDIFSILDTLQFPGDHWDIHSTDPISFQYVIYHMLEVYLLPDYGITVPYTIDTGDPQNTEIRGVFLPESYRDALKKACFAAGAYLDSSRRAGIAIHKMELASGIGSPDYALTVADFSLISVELKPLVTDVDIKYEVWDTKEELGAVKNVYQATGLPTGTYTIFFDEPILPDSLIATGATLTGIFWFWCSISVASGPQDVVITGNAFPKNATRNYVGMAVSEDMRNSVTLEQLHAYSLTGLGGTIVNAAQRLYDYYQQRYLVKIKTFASAMAVGDSVSLAIAGKTVIGIIEKMESDLTGGFTHKVDIVGIIQELA